MTSCRPSIISRSADAGTAAAHGQEGTFRERAPRGVRRIDLGQLAHAQQHLLLEDHGEDHVLVHAVAIDVVHVEAEEPRERLVVVALAFAFTLVLARVVGDALESVALVLHRLADAGRVLLRTFSSFSMSSSSTKS
jgi:hypothetical protein